MPDRSNRHFARAWGEGRYSDLPVGGARRTQATGRGLRGAQRKRQPSNRWAGQTAQRKGIYRAWLGRRWGPVVRHRLVVFCQRATQRADDLGQ